MEDIRQSELKTKSGDIIVEPGEVPDLTTLEFKNPGEFYTACLDHFKLTKTKVDDEVPEYVLSDPEQRQKAWQQIVAVYGAK